MKRFLTVTGAVVALAFPAALAQSPAPAQQTAPPPAQGEAAPAQPQQRAIHPMLAALQGMQVAVLQNSEGGVASVQSQSGTQAIVVFMTPAAAEAELQSVEEDDMRVGIVDLASILVDAGHIMAEIGETDAGDQSDISGANHCNAHGGVLCCSLIVPRLSRRSVGDQTYTCA